MLSKGCDRLLVALKDVANGLDLESVSSTCDTDRTAHEGCLSRLLDEARLDEALDTSYEARLLAMLFSSVVCGDTIAEGKLTGKSLFIANSAYRHRSTGG